MKLLINDTTEYYVCGGDVYALDYSSVEERLVLTEYNGFTTVDGIRF